MYNSRLGKRGCATGYDLTEGTITVYGNSDPVTTWDDACNWADSLYADRMAGYLSLPDKLKQEFGDDTDTLGFALARKADGKYGQFIARSYKNMWTDWDIGLNWCFGAYKTNCAEVTAILI